MYNCKMPQELVCFILLLPLIFALALGLVKRNFLAFVTYSKHLLTLQYVILHILIGTCILHVHLDACELTVCTCIARPILLFGFGMVG